MGTSRASRWSSSATTPSMAVSSRSKVACSSAVVRASNSRAPSGPSRASTSARLAADDLPIQRSTTSAGGDRPADLGQHAGLDDDGEPLGVDEHAVAVEDHQRRVGSCVRSSGGDRPGRRRRRRAPPQLVGQVDRGADVVGHDPEPAAERGQRVRPAQSTTAWCSESSGDPGGRGGRAAGRSRWPTPAGRRRATLLPESSTTLPAGVADHRRQAGQRDVAGLDAAELPLLRVAEHVDARAQLGEHARRRRPPRSASTRR